MQQLFNTLIDRFIDDQVGTVSHFLSDGLAAALKANLLRLRSAELMLAAGTGNEAAVLHNTLIRSDKIYWLDRSHENVHEDAFFNLMDLFVEHLNRTCYTGITGYEFHYALYEEGTFYKKHLDQFRSNDSRQYSMILYLNEGWVAADGGELCIHHADHLQHIAPENGTSVFFKSSELAHEVLLTHKARLSITGWLKIG